MQNAGQAAKSANYARIMQDCAADRKRIVTKPLVAAENTQGKAGLENGSETPYQPVRGAHETATTAKQSTAGSTAKRGEPGRGGRAEYTACGATGGRDE